VVPSAVPLLEIVTLLKRVLELLLAVPRILSKPVRSAVPLLEIVMLLNTVPAHLLAVLQMDSNL
jgi:hypothetical protein